MSYINKSRINKTLHNNKKQQYRYNRKGLHNNDIVAIFLILLLFSPIIFSLLEVIIKKLNTIYINLINRMKRKHLTVEMGTMRHKIIDNN